jgi:hypothetical protein
MAVGKKKRTVVVGKEKRVVATSLNGRPRRRRSSLWPRGG